MKAYKLTVRIYDYWMTQDKGGYVTIERYFTTAEKAADYYNGTLKNRWYNYHNELEPTTEHPTQATIKEITID